MICSNNLSIGSYKMGSDFDISVPNVVYPQVYAELTTSSISDKEVSLSFDVVVSDLLKHDNSNEIQVLNDMLSIVLDLRASLIANENENLRIELSSTIDPFTESSTDNTAGWVWSLTATIIDLKDRCNLPTL